MTFSQPACDPHRRDDGSQPEPLSDALKTEIEYILKSSKLKY